MKGSLRNYLRKETLGIILLISLLFSVYVSSNVLASSPSDNWSMFRNNLTHTGETTSQGPTAEVVKLWNFTTWGVVWSSPIVVGDKLYIGSDDGNLFCINAETGEKIWNYPTGQTVGTTPAVVGNFVYIASCDGNLYCLDINDGHKVWNYTTGNVVESTPAVVDGRVYIGSEDRKVYCFDASSGEKIWNYTTGDRIYSSPPSLTTASS